MPESQGGGGERHIAIARSPELSSSPRHEFFTLLVEAYERRRLFALGSKIRGKFYGYRWHVGSVRWTISQKGAHRQDPCCRHIHTGFECVFSTVSCGMLLAYRTGIGLQHLACPDVPVRTGSATGCEVAGDTRG